MVRPVCHSFLNWRGTLLFHPPIGAPAHAYVYVYIFFCRGKPILNFVLTFRLSIQSCLLQPEKGKYQDFLHIKTTCYRVLQKNCVFPNKMHTIPLMQESGQQLILARDFSLQSLSLAGFFLITNNLRWIENF